MKSSEVLKKLDISRSTLVNYIKDGKLHPKHSFTGRLDFTEEEVSELLNKKFPNKDKEMDSVSLSSIKQILDEQVKSSEKTMSLLTELDSYVKELKDTLDSIKSTMLETSNLVDTKFEIKNKSDINL